MHYRPLENSHELHSFNLKNPSKLGCFTASTRNGNQTFSLESVALPSESSFNLRKQQRSRRKQQCCHRKTRDSREVHGNLHLWCCDYDNGKTFRAAFSAKRPARDSLGEEQLLIKSQAVPGSVIYENARGNFSLRAELTPLKSAISISLLNERARAASEFHS